MDTLTANEAKTDIEAGNTVDGASFFDSLEKGGHD